MSKSLVPGAEDSTVDIHSNMFNKFDVILTHDAGLLAYSVDRL